MARSDIAGDPHGHHVHQARVMHVDKGVRAEVFSDANDAFPHAFGFGNRHVLWADADRRRAEFRGFGAVDQVHFR